MKDCSRNVFAIQDLLSERKSIPDKMFVMDAERLFSVLVCLAMSKR
ncbi:MAG: hypothetical protein MJZ93_05175 [Paludibacteraceae bacterium]|nr:hypothetical protein [Paludibacteraceae bacterium]